MNNFNIKKGFYYDKNDNKLNDKSDFKLGSTIQPQKKQETINFIDQNKIGSIWDIKKRSFEGFDRQRNGKLKLNLTK